MPELPEVETVVRDLRRHGLENYSITGIDVRWPRTVADITPKHLKQALTGRLIANVSRRAKYIVFTLDNGDRLLIHLRMTGKLRFAAPHEVIGKHDHIVLHLSGGQRLVFNDTRKFGRFRLAPAGSDPLANLGPEPLSDSFTADTLQARLRGKTGRIKPVLLDQTTVAGLGNIYVDEALWQARLHPERRADSLSRDDVRRLHRAIRDVLRRAIENCGTTLGNGLDNFYSVAGNRGRNADRLKVFRRDGLPCPRCGTVITRSVVAQRGTHFCPRCQPPVMG
jgi:formamidopyrimidine-DNA glycosylase